MREIFFKKKKDWYTYKYIKKILDNKITKKKFYKKITKNKLPWVIS